MRERYIGVMSGTSQNGIDAVLAEFDGGRFCGVVATHSGQYPAALREQLIELARESTPVALHSLARLDRGVADAFADVVIELVERGASTTPVRAVGSHGQTVFHDPAGVGSSLQLGDPGRIAVRTGLAVIADFRRADIALGGQGAPLMPAFHLALFGDDAEPRAVLNLGGIANLSLLPSSDASSVLGFDCGPGNCLLDEWAQVHLHTAHDEAGRWASDGRVDDALLAQCLADPYFSAPPPKSSGRGYFHLDWLARRAPRLPQLAPADVQRSLCELTAASVADAVLRHAAQTRRLLVCGGGTRNRFLMQRLRERLPGIEINTSEEFGVDAQSVEGAGFAWLACRRMREEPGNLPSVTGASRLAVLGGLYLP